MLCLKEKRAQILLKISNLLTNLIFLGEMVKKRIIMIKILTK
jgi:hypothetical protein